MGGPTSDHPTPFRSLPENFPMPTKTFAFVGTLNRAMPDFPPAHGSGIATFHFDEETGRMTLASTYEGIDNPSFLAVDASGRHLYASTEWSGRNEGLVTAFDIDPETGALTYINLRPTLGSVACHVSLDHTETLLFVANFTIAPEGSRPGQAVTAYRIREDGGISPPLSSVAHEGAEAILPVAVRSHAHLAVPSPDNRHLLVADLGLDRVMVYRLPPEGEQLQLAASPFAELPTGSGPRHLHFNGKGDIVYVINELGSTMATFAYDAETGGLSLLQILSTLPEDFSGTNYCAELVLSPDGRFLYGTNRGHDSIVRFAVQADGTLDLPDWTPTGGHWPRNLTFDPSGKFLLVANQHGDNIVIFRQQALTGALFQTDEIHHGTPMRIVFARL
jgi:6-phosphogluconolactonase